MVPNTGRLSAFITLLRPHQYIKNGFIFLPCYFGGKMKDISALATVVPVFVLFCLAASAIYIFNDLQDVEMDRKHPTKCSRPLASGAVSPREGIFLLSLLLLLSITGSVFLLDNSVFLILISYVVLNVLYSLSLKNLAILDLLCVSVGFVLRVFAGTFAMGMHVSHWLVMMTFLLALFLALAKRRDDLVIAAGNGASPRKSLDGYNLDFVSLSMVMSAAVTLVTYILYSVSPEVIARVGSSNLYFTSIFVIAGLLRYLQITFLGLGTGSPTRLVLKDTFLQIAIVLWLLSFYVLLYT